MGVAEITSQPYPDPTLDDVKRVVVDVRPLQRVSQPVTLSQIKQIGKFAEFDLLRLPRLSVVPVPNIYWQYLMELTSSSTSI
jgi:predicted RNA-binding protein with PUA-like domain